MSKTKTSKPTDEERLDILSEGTVKQAKELLTAEDKESKDKRNEVLNLIESKSGGIITYNRLIADLLIKRLYYYIDWGLWRFKVEPTSIGVILEMYSPTGKVHRAAFKPTGKALYDLNAIDLFAVRADNTINRDETRQRGTDTKDS